jgi:hypothetical protein
LARPPPDEADDLAHDQDRPDLKKEVNGELEIGHG